MIATDLHVGHAVEPMAGETEIWPTLALLPIGTTLADEQGHCWFRHRKWWAGSDGAQVTSQQLGERGPLTVHSVHVCEDWISTSTMCSATATSICTLCGATKEVPR